MTKKYRPCVGIALFNDKGELFIGRRTDHPDVWQMPQGGIDDGEDPKTAFFREMSEEIGTDKAEILEVLETTLRYDWPQAVKEKFKNKYVGQEQTWIAGRFTGNDNDINLESFDEVEFSEWKWITPEDIFNTMSSFKAETYKTVINAFKKHYS